MKRLQTIKADTFNRNADFKSDVYRQLTAIARKYYKNYAMSIEEMKEEFDLSYEWFTLSFFDDEMWEEELMDLM